jgi:hypothetical protein
VGIAFTDGVMLCGVSGSVEWPVVQIAPSS